ncbi:MAG: hypothetical protein Kow0063_15410 [Anaerolineae bacterium]
MGGRHAKHWHCVIFEPDPAAQWVPISDDMWRIYQEDRELTRGLGTRKLLNDGDPLFYLLDDDGNLVFFGPTKMFRLPYPNSPLGLVPADLQREPDLDLAEAIFGYTKSDAIPVEERACASRVIVTDAQFVSAMRAEWTVRDPITPRVLGSPKPTSFQHYLTQQDPDDKNQLDHYASPPPHETTIRGHKLYWHRGDVGLADIQESDQEALEKHPKQYTCIKPVRSQVTFKFHVHFENLRDFELGALLWALTLPGEPGKEYRHKLGMGKPLGMGSVHLQPTLRLSSREGKAGRYGRLFGKSEAGQLLPEWHVAESRNDGQGFVKAFNDYVLAHMDQDERDYASSLKDVPRIQMLLKMLEWPGPERGKTNYMMLEDFRPRPVLPDPLAVLAGRPVRDTAPRPRPRTETPPARGVETGTVKWFNDQKGYGFIAQDDGPDVFVHFSDIVGSGHRTLREGQRVTFTVVQDEKGPKAQNVRLLQE